MFDTQIYIESCLEVLEEQVNWIVNHKNNIDVVIQLGDLTQDNHPLEFGPSDKTLEWTNSIIGNNRDKILIINTHAYMYSDSIRMGEGNHWLPQNYGIVKDSLYRVNNREQIWGKLVFKHLNIIAVLSVMY